MEKQQASEKKIVMDYVSLAVMANCVVSFLLMIAVYYLFTFKFADEIIDGVVQGFLAGLINVVGVYLGVLYAARLTRNKYAIVNPDAIVLSSYVYLAVIELVVFFPISIMVALGPAMPMISENAGAFNLFFPILSTLVFVQASRKYLKS